MRLTCSLGAAMTAALLTVSAYSAHAQTPAMPPFVVELKTPEDVISFVRSAPRDDRRLAAIEHLLDYALKARDEKALLFFASEFNSGAPPHPWMRTLLGKERVAAIRKILLTTQSAGTAKGVIRYFTFTFEPVQELSRAERESLCLIILNKGTDAEVLRMVAEQRCVFSSVIDRAIARVLATSDPTLGPEIWQSSFRETAGLTFEDVRRFKPNR